MSKARTLAAIAVSCGMALTGALAWGQSEDRDSCVDACEQAKDQCINLCGAHKNPMECEDDCEDAVVDCTRMCR